MTSQQCVGASSVIAPTRHRLSALHCPLPEPSEFFVHFLATIFAASLCRDLQNGCKSHCISFVDAKRHKSDVVALNVYSNQTSTTTIIRSGDEEGGNWLATNNRDSRAERVTAVIRSNS